MTTNEIIDDVRRSCSIGITPWRACRAKEIAMDILEGDGQSNTICYMIMLQSRGECLLKQQ